ncbi:guanylate kinase [Seinonella peptonophila]|uniref:Guanylate kinase n=1 Tax=Seinonella peptonophila TaxID=112248 RepID=A0A1M4UWM1_9BACL|nr:guanylate kinase [Seinonella peptonophila]SHE61082.1 guanylate kinase [Seinonella peptonophila]
MEAKYQPAGLLIVVSGPSGVGKGTVCHSLRQRVPTLTYSVSATTRSPREGEQDGLNYFFKSHYQFKQMIEHDELIEWAEYVGNYYGTPRKFVENSLAEGRDVLLEIDVQGALQVKKSFPEGVFIFLLPPTFDDLRKRIENRGSETPKTLDHRLTAASEEVKQLHYYDYVVINDEVEQASERIQSIIVAEHCRRERILINH